MPNPDLIPEPFAQSGDKNPIPLERAITDPIYRASWKAGFPPDTRLPKDLGGEAPDGLDFNGVLNIISQAVVFLQKGNAYQFDASMAPYPIGALVRSNDNLTTYQSTVPNNSNNPNSNMTGWRVYNGSGFIVDNLTTNDSAKALSAAQGKVLQDNKLGKTENAASATKLQTARTIGGVDFDGSANINLPGVNATGNQNTIGNAATATKLATAVGSAPSFSARAWVNFNGTGVVAIRGEGNVSSITDLGVGVYKVNFTTPMPDTNYCAVGSSCRGSSPTTGNDEVFQPYLYETAGLSFYLADDTSGLVDALNINVAIFR